MLESNSGASGLQIFIRCLHHLSSWSSLRKQRTIFDCRCGFPTLVAAWRYYREQCLWWQRGFKVTLGRTRTDSRKLKPRMFFFFCQNEEEGFHKVCEKTPRIQSNRIRFKPQSWVGWNTKQIRWMKTSLPKSLTSYESVVASEKKDPRKTLRDLYSHDDFMVISIPAIHRFNVEKCFSCG